MKVWDNMENNMENETSVKKKTLSHLPQRPPVNIEFQDLTYTVPQGRKGQYTFICVIIKFIFFCCCKELNNKNQKMLVIL